MTRFFVRFIVCLAVGMLMLSSARAVQPDEILDDPALEARARALSYELRCLVCQNQSIDDSNAPLARDLRVLVRERLSAGDTDSEAMDYIVARYGEYVLLRPPFGWHTLLLWLAPLGVLILAVGFVFARMRAGSGDVALQPLTAAEEDQLRELLADEPGQKPSKSA